MRHEILKITRFMRRSIRIKTRNYCSRQSAHVYLLAFPSVFPEDRDLSDFYTFPVEFFSPRGLVAFPVPRRTIFPGNRRTPTLSTSRHFQRPFRLYVFRLSPPSPPPQKNSV